jgi:hypothetical protein
MFLRSLTLSELYTAFNPEGRTRENFRSNRSRVLSLPTSSVLQYCYPNPKQGTNSNTWTLVRVPNRWLSQEVQGVTFQFHVTDIIRQCLFATWTTYRRESWQRQGTVALWILEHTNTFLAGVQGPPPHGATLFVVLSLLNINILLLEADTSIWDNRDQETSVVLQVARLSPEVWSSSK